MSSQCQRQMSVFVCSAGDRLARKYTASGKQKDARIICQDDLEKAPVRNGERSRACTAVKTLIGKVHPCSDPLTRKKFKVYKGNL